MQKQITENRKTQERVGRGLLDLTEEMFANEDLIAAVGIRPAQIQQWLARGLLQVTGQKPGTGQRRQYSAHEALSFVIMSELNHFGIPASIAGGVAMQITQTLPQFGVSYIEFAVNADAGLSVLIARREDKDYEVRPVLGTDKISDFLASFTRLGYKTTAVLNVSALIAEPLIRLERIAARKPGPPRRAP